MKMLQKINPNFYAAVTFIASTLQNRQYCIRGTASLVLQNISMGVSDIDVLCDKATAEHCNELFSQYVVERVQYQETKKFKSFFGKFNIFTMPVDVYGDWQIKDGKGNWSSLYNAATFDMVELDSQQIKVSKISDELQMYIEMGRFSAYHKIKKQLQQTSSVAQNKGLFE